MAIPKAKMSNFFLNQRPWVTTSIWKAICGLEPKTLGLGFKIVGLGHVMEQF